jgi:hypothetical protein
MKCTSPTTRFIDSMLYKAPHLKVKKAMKPLRQLLYGAISILILFLAGGCEQKLPSKDFGTIVDGIPQVQGADKPFEMPLLGPPPPEDPSQHKRH